MAGEALYYGTGRRKNAVARVRLVPGTGKVTVNGKFIKAVNVMDFPAQPFKIVIDDGQAVSDLGKKEISDIIEEQGEAEMTCRFCDNVYNFSKDELTELMNTAKGEIK